MDVFSKAKLVVWTIIVLVLLNILSLGTLWYTGIRRPMPPDFPPEPGGPGFNRFFGEELGLNEEQAKKFEVARDQYIEKTAQIRVDINRLSRDMYNELFKTSPDQTVIDSIFGEIGKLRASQEKVGLEHFNELKKICRPEQYPGLRKLIDEIINIARPAQNPPPPGQRPDRPDHH